MNRAVLLAAAVLLLTGCDVSRRPGPDEISEHVRSILELPTFEHVYRDVIYIDRERSFLMFKTRDTEVLFSIDVRIQAGLDLTKGLSISQNGRTVEVFLPDAEILLADADESSIEQYLSLIHI